LKFRDLVEGRLIEFRESLARRKAMRQQFPHDPSLYTTLRPQEEAIFMAQEVAQKVWQNGGKFLQCIDTAEGETKWTEVTQSAAIQMTLQTFFSYMGLDPNSSTVPAESLLPQQPPGLKRRLSQESEPHSSIYGHDKRHRTQPPTARELLQAEAPSRPLKEVVPRDEDVFCGAGCTPYLSRGGNLKFHSLVSERHARYHNSTDPSVRDRLIRKVKKGIRKTGGKFIHRKHASGPWHDVSDEMIKDLIETAFASTLFCLDPSEWKIRLTDTRIRAHLPSGTNPAQSGIISESQYQLGCCFKLGLILSVEQDYAIARFWFEKAAQLGHAEAQLELAKCYHQGQGVQKQDYQQAVHWYLQAATKFCLAANPQLVEEQNITGLIQKIRGYSALE